MVNQLLQIDSQKPLFKNFSFWFLALLPILVGVVLGLIVWINYSPLYTPEGYDRFLAISKLPIGVMGLTFPFTAIYVYQYKSKQDTNNSFILKERELINKFDSKISSLSNLTLSLTLLNKRLCALESLREEKREPIESVVDSAFAIYSDWIDLLKGGDYLSLLASEQDLVEEIESHLIALRIIINNPQKKHWSGNFKAACRALKILSYKVSINIGYVHTKRYQEVNELRKNYGLLPDDITAIEKADSDKVKQYENSISNIRTSAQACN